MIRFNALTSLILFALIFSGRHDSIINRVGMEHYRNQIESGSPTASPPFGAFVISRGNPRG